MSKNESANRSPVSRAGRSYAPGDSRQADRWPHVGFAAGGALGRDAYAVAQHLQILEEAGLVHTEKLGRVRTCRMEPAGLSRSGAMDSRSSHVVGAKARPAGRNACRRGRERLTELPRNLNQSISWCPSLRSKGGKLNSHLHNTQNKGDLCLESMRFHAVNLSRRQCPPRCWPASNYVFKVFRRIRPPPKEIN